jgi:hypothetical protein
MGCIAEPASDRGWGEGRLVPVFHSSIFLLLEPTLRSKAGTERLEGSLDCIDALHQPPDRIAWCQHIV